MKLLQRCQAILAFSCIAFQVMFRNHYYHIKKLLSIFRKMYYPHSYRENKNYID